MTPTAIRNAIPSEHAQTAAEVVARAASQHVLEGAADATWGSPDQLEGITDRLAPFVDHVRELRAGRFPAPVLALVTAERDEVVEMVESDRKSLARCEAGDPMHGYTGCSQEVSVEMSRDNLRRSERELAALDAVIEAVA